MKHSTFRQSFFRKPVTSSASIEAAKRCHPSSDFYSDDDPDITIDRPEIEVIFHEGETPPSGFDLDLALDLVSAIHAEAAVSEEQQIDVKPETVKEWLEGKGLELLGGEAPTPAKKTFHRAAANFGRSAWGAKLARTLGHVISMNDPEPKFVGFMDGLTKTSSEVTDTVDLLDAAGVVMGKPTNNGYRFRFNAQNTPNKQEWRKQFTGGWLEIFAYDIVQQLIDQRGSGDILRNVQVRSAAGVRHEFDALAIIDGEPLYIEAKAGKNYSHSLGHYLEVSKTFEIPSERAIVVLGCFDEDKLEIQRDVYDLTFTPAWELRSYLQSLYPDFEPAGPEVADTAPQPPVSAKETKAEAERERRRRNEQILRSAGYISARRQENGRLVGRAVDVIAGSSTPLTADAWITRLRDVGATKGNAERVVKTLIDCEICLAKDGSPVRASEEEVAALSPGGIDDIFKAINQLTAGVIGRAI